jgi:DNA-binding NarL/FixJ family response regulator
MATHSILFIRSEENRARQVEEALDEGFLQETRWTRVDSLFDGLRMLQEHSFSLIFSELSLPDGDASGIVLNLRQDAPRTPLIGFCSRSERDLGIHAVRRGANDFFCYDDLDEGSLQRAVNEAMSNADNESRSSGGADRRTNARFPCRLAVSYQALEDPSLTGHATSETINISSKGLLFAASHDLQPGQLLQVSVNWPARLGNEIPLQLVAEGRVVRNVDGLTAMRIDKYEFKTRRQKTLRDRTTQDGPYRSH